MDLSVVIAGLGLGFLSSFHCVGMCGPIALSLPLKDYPNSKKNGALLLYHGGRIFIYIFLGVLLGLLGRRFYFAGWQQAISIGTGSIILLVSFRYYFLKKNSEPIWLQRFHLSLFKSIHQFLNSGKLFHYFYLGILNGLLPCGMVYLAIAGALNTHHLRDAALFMASFGMATLPALLVLSWLGMSIDINVRRKFQKWIPYFAITMAVILILRGLNLGIPFISPVLVHDPGNAASCH